MPTFNDKSVQGIIDIIHAELTCFGTISDKSIKAIINAADAQGITITDHSVQGIIDALASASCAPPLPIPENLISTSYFSWTPTNIGVLTGGPDGDQSVLVSDSYGPSITGIHTGSSLSPSQPFIALASIQVFYGGSLIRTINQPISSSKGMNVGREYNDVWGNTSSGKVYDSSYGKPWCWTATFDSGGHYYNMCPSIYYSSYGGATAICAGNSATSWKCDEANMLPYVPVGGEVTILVRSAAVKLSSGDELSWSRFGNVDLFLYDGISELTYTKNATSTASNIITSAGTHNYNELMWNGISNPL